MLIAFGAALAMAGTASAATVSGFLSMSSPQGDYIGQGRDYLFTFPERSSVVQAVKSPNGDFDLQLPVLFPSPGVATWWSVRLSAAVGQPLVPGDYLDAQRASFREPGHPGIDISGDGRGCNQIAGSFHVLQADFTARGELKTFHATFEQRCEFFMPPLTGEVLVETDAVTDSIDVTLNPVGALRQGKAVIGGVVSCTTDHTVDLAGALSQLDAAGRETVEPFSVQVACVANANTQWSAAVKPAHGSFRRAPATVRLDSSTSDGLRAHLDASVSLTGK